MKKNVTLKIPCKPHVLAFIEAKFKVPYQLSLNDYFGIIVYHILRRPEQDPNYVADEGIYTDVLQIKLPPVFVFNKGMTNITDYTTYKINNLVESMINEHFFEYMDSRLYFVEGSAAELNIKKSIIEWMDRYNFREDKFINYANLQQKYFRYRKLKKQKKSS